MTIICDDVGPARKRRSTSEPRNARRNRAIGDNRCSRCSAEMVNNAYCAKHQVIKNMRTHALHYGKSVPSWNELDAMFMYHGMHCKHCRKRMLLRSNRAEKPVDRNAVVTLQHNNDGSICLLCHSCNVSHRHYGDALYTFPKGLTKVKGFWVEADMPLVLKRKLASMFN